MAEDGLFEVGLVEVVEVEGFLEVLSGRSKELVLKIGENRSKLGL